MIVKANKENTLPEFIIDEINGIVEIKGRSISMEVEEFFKPLIEYLENFLMYNPMDITVNINLDYFNTKTSRLLLHIFKLIKHSVEVNEYKLTVNWYYEEEDGDMEAGEDYANILGMTFNFVQN